ncbi:hypothetical protein PAECIP111893_02066 [Paenibacillus plantiphilus]|uniref:Uncharacterized protein n=1 Tax=Paenibacillus plantiphilus TaxID=2905650 RepID=A0ABN8G9X2_9BACL|nr:hypothetical protein PAECIP111893_02066 [Paenibacillus plantiphilus]
MIRININRLHVVCCSRFMLIPQVIVASDQAKDCLTPFAREWYYANRCTNEHYWREIKHE